MSKDRFNFKDLKDLGHGIACRCDSCLIVLENIWLFREWHKELNGACILSSETNKCVGCVNCALDPTRAIIQSQV